MINFEDNQIEKDKYTIGCEPNSTPTYFHIQNEEANRGQMNDFAFNSPDYAEINGKELRVDDANAYGFMCNTNEHKLMFLPKGKNHQEFIMGYAKYIDPTVKGTSALLLAKQLYDKFDIQGRVWVNVPPYDGVLTTWNNKKDKTIFNKICSKFHLNPQNTIYLYGYEEQCLLPNLDCNYISNDDDSEIHALHLKNAQDKWDATQDFRDTRNEKNTQYNQEHGYSCDAEKHFRETLDEMIVYHGTGADFDAFDHTFMSSGEGAQAFGWGTYVTSDLGTAKYYSKVAKDNNGIYYCNNKLIPKDIYVALQMITDKLGNNFPYSTDKLSILMSSTLSSIQRLLNKQQNKNIKPIQLDKLEHQIEMYQLGLKFLQNFNEDIKSLSVTKNRIVLEVDIPEDTVKNYIEWDEKSERVNQLAYKLNCKECINKTFGDLYSTQTFLNPKELSEYLSKQGLIGIKIPTGYLTGGNGKGFNYVIFNEKNIKIIDKYDLV